MVITLGAGNIWKAGQGFLELLGREENQAEEG
jgi:hypothetical protein